MPWENPGARGTFPKIPGEHSSRSDSLRREVKCPCQNQRDRESDEQEHNHQPQ